VQRQRDALAETGQRFVGRVVDSSSVGRASAVTCAWCTSSASMPKLPVIGS